MCEHQSLQQSPSQKLETLRCSSTGRGEGEAGIPRKLNPRGVCRTLLSLFCSPAALLTSRVSWPSKAQSLGTGGQSFLGLGHLPSSAFSRDGKS